MERLYLLANALALGSATSGAQAEAVAARRRSLLDQRASASKFNLAGMMARERDETGAFTIRGYLAVQKARSTLVARRQFSETFLPEHT